MSDNNSVCRKCRRIGSKLMLKGDRCSTPKCAFTKRPYAPGATGNSRGSKLSDFGVQLKEKQKAKSIYNLRENQFHNYYLKASKTKEASGEKLIQFLETRLDNVVFRLGLASTIRNARQVVGHKNILVNGNVLDIPSYQLRKGEKVEPKKKENYKLFKTEIPVWLKFDKGKLSGEIINDPKRSEINTDINEDLIVEFYSR